MTAAKLVKPATAQQYGHRAASHSTYADWKLWGEASDARTAASEIRMLEEIWSGIMWAVGSWFRLFTDLPPPIPQIADLRENIIQNKDLITNILDLASFLFITPELAKRFLPSRKMLFQNYLMLFIILLPIYSVYMTIAWLISGFYWHAGIWSIVCFGSSRGLILSWREDAKVVEPLLIGERVSKLLLPFGIILFLIARVLGLYAVI